MSSIDCSVSAALCSTPLVLYYDKQEEAVVLFFTTSETNHMQGVLKLTQLESCILLSTYGNTLS
uniref:Uncharacterized protein n=1 Tax=Arion vulgaris TaxID=1028688 RepID=A0A0B7AKL0_9EUPU